MEPLPIAQIASLTPKDVEIEFWDDRMEEIPYDRVTDLVAISIETYTSKRAYQIASEYRRRGVPVVMGGFHATLMPEEVSEYAEAVVVGEAEIIWEKLIKDFKAGKMKKIYQSQERPDIEKLNIIPDRSIFKDKNYLPITLIEANRGCTFSCDFCAIQTAFKATQSRRSAESIVTEIQSQKNTKFFFFVDDNMISHVEEAKKLFKALIPLKIKWVSQASINMTYDDELMDLMKKSGCLGVLIGFESLNADNLKSMNKGFNLVKGGPIEAVKRLNEKGFLLYATFVFGREYDTLESFQEVIDFGMKNKIFMLAFNHMTPFPATPFYKKLKDDNKLLYDCWWLDDRYKYGEVPFKLNLDPLVIQEECVKARKNFYSIINVFKRMFSKSVITNFKILKMYLFINFLLRKEAAQRERYPLGDLAYKGEILKATNK
ncbi:MAG: B12-binding domain-containing radical SAM protein [Oligoflexia bacterium]|nr:B12-binding domain-containing radical SAM protein [Oligoflexia bacterium]